MYYYNMFVIPTLIRNITRFRFTTVLYYEHETLDVTRIHEFWFHCTQWLLSILTNKNSKLIETLTIYFSVLLLQELNSLSTLECQVTTLQLTFSGELCISKNIFPQCRDWKSFICSRWREEHSISHDSVKC